MPGLPFAAYVSPTEDIIDTCTPEITDDKGNTQYQYSDAIWDPADLEEMSEDELEELAQEAQELGCSKELQSITNYMKAKGMQSSFLQEPADGTASWLEEEDMSDGEQPG